jgi:hypothetical protein
METTIPTSAKLMDILKEIPQEVQEMYQIVVESFMSERYKLYIKSPVWISLSEHQIEQVVVYPNSVEIKCETICVVLQRLRSDIQVIVF